jgi:16S rRNA (guanine527-N7)-methyltransferase
MMQIGSKKWKNIIYDGAKHLEIQMDWGKIDQFAIHALELSKWTRKINLTAISDPLDMAVKHFLDSIAPVPMIPKDVSLLDMGSGGGFPGIPLKVMMPSLSVTLIDASRKKVSFLNHVIRILGLNNIEAIHVRAEDLFRDGNFNPAYDIIISRALSSMVNFVQMSLPLLSKDGSIIAMKGKISAKKIESELSLVRKRPENKENSTSNFNVILKKYRLPYLKSERSLVILKSIH